MTLFFFFLTSGYSLVRGSIAMLPFDFEFSKKISVLSSKMIKIFGIELGRGTPTKFRLVYCTLLMLLKF